MSRPLRGSTDSIGATHHRSDAETVADAITELNQLDASGLNRRLRSDMPEQTSHFKTPDQDLEDLSRLDVKGLARRWRMLIGGAVPPGLGRALMLRMLSYRLQAQRYGDLDRASRQALNEIFVRSVERTGHDGPDRLDAGRTAAALRAPQLRPGTVLSREYAGILHRVFVEQEGFRWNQKTFDSLSKVALAITGTRWNGPRFFGLRDRKGGAGSANSSKADGSRAPSDPQAVSLRPASI